MKQTLEHNFSEAKKKNRKAQKWLYDAYSGKMLAIAQSYTANFHDAEDILVEAFYKAFTKIETCQSAENFPFWLRKIVVNEALSFIRKNKNILFLNTDVIEDIEEEESFPDLDIDIEELLVQMPMGYRMVFNLFVFEDKKHSEIAELLNISEGTSKSQFNKAKKWLKEILKKYSNETTY